MTDTEYVLMCMRQSTTALKNTIVAAIDHDAPVDAVYELVSALYALERAAEHMTEPDKE